MLHEILYTYTRCAQPHPPTLRLIPSRRVISGVGAEPRLELTFEIASLRGPGSDQSTPAEDPNWVSTRGPSTVHLCYEHHPRRADLSVEVDASRVDWI